jgi:hypothetical protein
VTEAEWLACTEVENMLDYLRGKASDRKLRLFAVNCLRQAEQFRWGKLTVSQDLEMAERYPDGEITLARLQLSPYFRDLSIGEGYMLLAHPPPFSTEAAVRVLRESPAVAAGAATTSQDCYAAKNVARDQCHLLRCIFGNPFSLVCINPAWLTWHDDLLVSMAQRIYNSSDFSDMPVLADALEEAGCADADLLAHLRGPGPHARGCFALDLLLGKQ